MSDGQTLFAILCLLYLSDCFLWIGKHTVAFHAPWPGRWRVALADPIFGNAHGGILFVNPLSPPGNIFLCDLAPVSFSPIGICAYNPQSLPVAGRPAQSGRALAFTGISKASTDDTYLVIDNARFAKFAMASQAGAAAVLINAVVASVPGEREKLVRAYIDRQFADDEAARILREAARIAGPIKWLGYTLFFFLFLATPLMVSAFGLLRLLIPAAILMLGAATTIAVIYARAHKTLFPGARHDRIADMAKMVLCPPVSIRAADLLTRRVVANFNPVVIANLLATPAAWEFVRAYVLDLRHPVKHELADRSAAEIVAWAATRQLEGCLAIINRANTTNAGILFAAPRRENGSAAYCPRCGCQFGVAPDECPDCPGVKVMAFTEGPAGIGGA